ncbi:hypothetical protein [Rhodococcus sp. CH91]|uniref:hypothetical protein n=1 Tax=Rhodococcus sp. CH91 TaxID=2910256 RepID=UPI001F4B7FE1|nr:hypothetical protein [Rhodococcus sp. CH91]
MTRATPWAAVVVLVLAVLLAGWMSPVRPASVRSDALGPDHGEVVADYLARAGDSLADDADGLPRWGLVSFVAPVGMETVVALGSDVRVGQILFRVPIDRVQTPLVSISVPENPEAVRRAQAAAAGRLSALRFGTERAQRAGAVSAQRLAAGCECVVGAVVRGTPAQLRAVAAVPSVRVVEALPPDAVAGRFSVSPLLPEHVDKVVPGPDDGQL